MTQPRHRGRRSTHMPGGTLPPTVLSDPAPLIGRERQLEVPFREKEHRLSDWGTDENPARF